MFTHKELVQIAYKWMMKNCGVGVGFKELRATGDEIPDVIGFDSSKSILIECKVSRGDFLSDKDKPHRAKGMGNWRFYCCPAGLIKVADLPPKWGLVYVNEKGKARIEYDCRVKKVPYDKPQLIFNKLYTHRQEEAIENKFDADTLAERRLMYSALRRLHLRGRIEEIYTLTPEVLVNI